MTILEKIAVLDGKIRQVKTLAGRYKKQNEKLISENRDLRERLRKAAEVVDKLQDQLAEAERNNGKVLVPFELKIIHEKMKTCFESMDKYMDDLKTQEQKAQKE